MGKPKGFPTPLPFHVMLLDKGGIWGLAMLAQKVPKYSTVESHILQYIYVGRGRAKRAL